MVRILHVNKLPWTLFGQGFAFHIHRPGHRRAPRRGGNGMTPKEWSVEAFETCDHGGMICMSCAEKTIRAAIEEDRALLLCEARKQNGADELLWEATPSVLKSRA